MYNCVIVDYRNIPWTMFTALVYVLGRLALTYIGHTALMSVDDK